MTAPLFPNEVFPSLVLEFKAVQQEKGRASRDWEKAEAGGLPIVRIQKPKQSTC
jgi:hypothetical protein